MTIKELLTKNECVYFSILLDDKDIFLKQVKTEGFRWLNGEEIKETDCCNGHMAVHSDMRIASVPWFAWFHPDRSSVPKYSFSEFTKGILVTAKDVFVSFSLQ